MHPDPPRFTPGPVPATPAPSLAEAPTAALAFALGYAVARPVDANQFGPFCAMVEELQQRPSGLTEPGPVGGYDQRSVWGQLMSLLPDDMSRRIVLLYQAQRGQRWARTKQHPPK